jgi:hypothetical protein
MSYLSCYKILEHTKEHGIIDFDVMFFLYFLCALNLNLCNLHTSIFCISGYIFIFLAMSQCI